MPPLSTIPQCHEAAFIITTASLPDQNYTDPHYPPDDDDIDSDDLSALLYIVVTLLFYSMGIVVGIITYLKRERADMEEDKLFDEYLSMKRDPFNLHRQERVRQTARFLHNLELAKEKERRERERLAAAAACQDATTTDADTGESGEDSSDESSPRRGSSKKSKHVKISDCVPIRSQSFRSAGSGSKFKAGDERRNSDGDLCGGGESMYPLVLSTVNALVGSSTSRAPPVVFTPSSTVNTFVGSSRAPTVVFSPPSTISTIVGSSSISSTSPRAPIIFNPPHHYNHTLSPSSSDQNPHLLPPTFTVSPPTFTVSPPPPPSYASVVKPPEHERRGALPIGAKALHIVNSPDTETAPSAAVLIAGPIVSEPPRGKGADKNYFTNINRVLDL